MSSEPPGGKPHARTLAESRRWELMVGGLVLAAGLGVAGWYAWGLYHWRQAQQAHAQLDFGRARAHLARCLKVWPGSGDAHLLMARSCRRAGDFPEARDHLKKADQLGADTNDLDLEYVLLDAEDGDILAAQRVLLGRVKARDPNELLILEALTKGCLKAHYLPEAVVWAGMWLERRPDDVQALYARGSALKSGQLQPQSPGLELAKQDFRRLLALQPDHSEARGQLAELLEMGGAHPEALEHFDRYRQVRPDDPKALVGQVRCLRALGRIADARTTLESWFAKQRQAPADAYVLRALVELELDGKPEDALAWLQQAVAQAPNHDDAHHNLALVLRRLGRSEEAQRHEATVRDIRRTLERLHSVCVDIAKNVSSADRRHEAGLLHMKLGDEERALLWWLSALQDDPNHQPTHEVLAEFFEKKGERSRAAEHRARARGLKPVETNPASPRRRF